MDIQDKLDFGSTWNIYVVLVHAQIPHVLPKMKYKTIRKMGRLRTFYYKTNIRFLCLKYYMSCFCGCCILLMIGKGCWWPWAGKCINMPARCWCFDCEWRGWKRDNKACQTQWSSFPRRLGSVRVRLEPIRMSLRFARVNATLMRCHFCNKSPIYITIYNECLIHRKINRTFATLPDGDHCFASKRQGYKAYLFLEMYQWYSNQRHPYRSSSWLDPRWPWYDAEGMPAENDTD